MKTKKIIIGIIIALYASPFVMCLLPTSFIIETFSKVSTEWKDASNVINESKARLLNSSSADDEAYASQNKIIELQIHAVENTLYVRMMLLFLVVTYLIASIITLAHMYHSSE